MQTKILLSIMLLILAGLILSIGCGGGNNGVTPSSLTPTPNNLTGYITIKIAWPQKGLAGSCLISSGNDEDTLTASIPADVSLIEVKIRDANESTPNNNTLTNGYYAFI